MKKTELDFKVLNMHLNGIRAAIELQSLGDAIEKETLLTLERGDGLGFEEDIEKFSRAVNGLFDRRAELASCEDIFYLMRAIRDFIEIYARFCDAQATYDRIVFGINFALSKHYGKSARLKAWLFSPLDIRSLPEISTLHLVAEQEVRE